MRTQRAVTATLMAAILVAGPIAAATAQQEMLKPGARVRVTAPELRAAKQVAILEAWRGDTLVLVADSTFFYPVGSITRLEVSWRKRSHTSLGAGLGLIAGIAIGVGASAHFASECRKSGQGWCDTAYVLTPLGALVGTLAGAFIGGRVKTDRWVEVPLDQLLISVVPRRNGLALGISVAF